ncbi:MAG: isoaspartyl peptidase/L-asparaginase [Desulfurococcales archaeon]|nr:isoaspartyl peptidase/L-asparaginase [Desulfurococcales archaeon]
MPSSSDTVSSMRGVPPILLVHGGAGAWRTFRNKMREVVTVLRNALRSGYEVLGSASAIEAVVEAVKVLEDSGILNAGLGSVVDVRGEVTMDAGVMEGCGMRAGAVAAVTYPRNPVVLAKLVMEKTDHVLVVGRYADELARLWGLQKHPGPAKRVLERYSELVKKLREGEIPFKRFKKNYFLAKQLLGSLHDTVGAVALDSNGCLAAAVSTGGILMKIPGRVGDSAIPGAGFYADDHAAAVATGIGETIILSFLTLRTVSYVREGLHADEAARKAMDRHTKLFGEGTAGLIVVDRDGYFDGIYNTEGMPWGYIAKDSGDARVLGLPNSTSSP